MTLKVVMRFYGLSQHYLRSVHHQNALSKTRQCHQLLYDQVRHAGHAKRQNIAGTKLANDVAKGKLVSRYVLLVRRAIISNNMQADPKLNGKLADVLSEANKFNVPKATLERAIARAINIKVISCNMEIHGPGGCAIIARCETDNPGLLKREIKKLLRKFDSTHMPDDSLINMFQSRGFVRAAIKTIDNREIDEDFAEEAAIMANAEEVNLETYENASDPELSKAWVFSTDALRLNPCKGELEKLGVKIISHDLELVPYRTVDFGNDTYEKIVELIKTLSDHEQIVDVFHNACPPSDG